MEMIYLSCINFRTFSRKTRICAKISLKQKSEPNIWKWEYSHLQMRFESGYIKINSPTNFKYSRQQSAFVVTKISTNKEHISKDNLAAYPLVSAWNFSQKWR